MKGNDFIFGMIVIAAFIAVCVLVGRSDAARDKLPDECAQCAEYRQQIQGMTTRIEELEQQIETINRGGN